MPASSSPINYNLRPAKHVERKMLCEAFRRLAQFGPIEAYRYVGFGSYYFKDFSLFHKSLGITNMISIERDTTNRDRYKFNNPYRCIRVQFGSSNRVLPQLGWGTKTIMWLDYTDKINAQILSDVMYFCANAIPGSVLVISVNAHPAPNNGEFLQHMQEDLGEDRIPGHVTKQSLTLWGLAKASHEIIRNEIDARLLQRNGANSAANQLRFEQIVHFNYKDGAQMLTVGGVFYAERQREVIERCRFRDLPFVSSGNNAYLIEVPHMTFREIRFLDRQLPLSGARQLRAQGIPSQDLEKYSSLYRYFPTFADVDM